MATPPGKHAAKAEDFYLKEYECLRKEIEWLLQDYRALERNVVIAVGGSWAWLFLQRKDVPSWSWWLPCVFVALGAVRGIGITKTFSIFHRYILRLEETFSLPDDPGGWQHFCKGKTSSSKIAVVFWLILLVASVAVAVYGPKTPQASAAPTAASGALPKS